MESSKPTECDVSRPILDALLQRLRAHARILHRRVQQRQPAALSRASAASHRADARSRSLERDDGDFQRRHSLAVVASELGFSSWLHLVRVIHPASTVREGGSTPAPRDAEAPDFGTLMYPVQGGPAFWNVWSADYKEAQSIRAESGGYLLPYKRQFFVCDRYFIETLGSTAEDTDWDRIGRDWVDPAEAAAHARLTQRLVEYRLSANVWPGPGAPG